MGLTSEKPDWVIEIVNTHKTISDAHKARRALYLERGADQDFMVVDVRLVDWIHTTDPWAVVRVR